MTKIYSLFIALLCLFFNNVKANIFYHTGDSLQINKNSLNYKSVGKSVSVFPLDNFSSFINNDPETDKEIGKAIGAFGELEKSGNFTNTINPNELTEFPIGLKENVSNVEYGIVVTKAQFTPEYALINVYARVVTPQAGAEGGKRTLYFGAEGVKLSYGGKIIGDAKLSLLGDINIPFNQNQWMLTLEGGMINKFTGQSINDKTYVVIDCDGITELSLKGNVQISRNVLVPLDSNGKMLPEIGNDGFTNRVRGDFALKASDWNDILVNVSITPFAITSQIKNQDKGFFSFYVNNAVLDLSDLRTDSTVLFPQYYASHGYLIGGTETWRGLYVESLYVGLPQEFKTEDHIDNRVSFQAQNLLIDSYGVSGSFSANNLFPLEKGITSEQNSWRYSLDQIGVDLAASKIVGANLKGKIQLPVQKPDNANPNNNLPNHLGYQGVITEEEYMITVATLDEISFDIWSAKATIAPGSYLELKVKNREFLPKAVLTGTLAIGANGKPAENNNDSNVKKDADFKGVKFQELTLQTKAPYITAQYFGVQGEQKLVGFPASIKNIFVEADNGYANLGFEITVGLQEERFSASGGMKINGLIVNENNRQRWKYDGFNLTKLGLKNVDIGVAIVSGEFQIMRNDPLYGDGFTAHLNAKLKQLDIEVNVNAAYGFSTFRYWGFEGSVTGLSIQASLLKITGFTGGAFYRMIPDRELSINPENENKALVLKPDNTIGLTLRAGIYGSVPTDNTIDIMAGFNISTNPNGGLANIGFIGEAVIMADISRLIPGDPMAGVKNKFKEMVGNPNYLADIKKGGGNFLDTQMVDEQYPVTKDVKGNIYAKLAMNYDFNNSIFHASLDVFVNIANGIIAGIGPSGRAGSAVLHIAPSEWYMHIGTPTQMIGLKVGFGSFSLQSGSYFMVGTRIPGSPPPPPEVAEILGLQLNDIDYMSSLNALGEGKGFAFGTHLKFDTGDMTALFLYARFQAGLGTDIMLKDYDEAKCSNRGGEQIGINGWYASGQAYVYLQGELGIKIKLWFIKKKIPIIKAGVASLLQAKGPNPYWVRGYLGGYYNLLGGMIKGRFRFKMEFGEECILENASVLGGMKIITDLTPKKDDTNVDVFAIPQATFAMRVNEPIVIPEDDGDHTYKIVVEKMTIVDDQGKEIKGVIEYANSKDVANFVSDDILPPSKTLKAITQVSFMEKKNGMYEVVMVDGQKAIEVEERSFTTGTAPNVIPLSNIKYAYPVAEQENYYTQESNKGYIKLKRGQDYLFDDPNWSTKTVFAADSQTESNFSYDGNDNVVNFNVPTLGKQKDYTLALIAKNKNGNTANNGNTNTGQSGNVLNSTGGVDNTTSNPDVNTNEDSSITTTTETKTAQNLSKDGEIDRLSFVFRTSKYNTMSDKLSVLNFNPLWVKVDSEVVFLQNNMNADEYFDVTEITGTKYTDNKPLINLTALMDDSFAAKFKGLFYNAYPIDQLTLDRAENEEDFAGIPPVKAFPVFTAYMQYLGSDKGNTFLKQTFPYKYDLFRLYKSDWYELVSKSASKYVGVPANARPQAINNLLLSTYGVIPTIKYKVKAKYTLPGDKAGSEKQIDYEFK